MSRKPDVAQLLEDHDLEGLMEALRYPQDASVRAEAAKALGEMNDSQAVESLIRSFRLDPALEVQAAARRALEEMFGNRAQAVIEAYPVYADEKAWPAGPSSAAEEEEFGENDEAEEEEEEAEEEAGNAPESDSLWSADDLYSLTTILRAEKDLHLRVRAAHALGEIGAHDLQAVETLAATVLHGDNPSVREAAMQALEKLYGKEGAQDVVDTYRAISEGKDEVDAASFENGEDAAGVESVAEDIQSPAIPTPEKALQMPAPIPYDRHEAVMRDEGAGHLGQALLIGAIVLVVIALVAYFAIYK